MTNYDLDKIKLFFVTGKSACVCNVVHLLSINRMGFCYLIRLELNFQRSKFLNEITISVLFGVIKMMF